MDGGRLGNSRRSTTTKLALACPYSSSHSTCPPHTPQCLDKSKLSWTSSPNGGILLNGEPFHMKGISWFGIEKNEEILHGLNKRCVACFARVAIVCQHINGWAGRSIRSTDRPDLNPSLHRTKSTGRP